MSKMTEYQERKADALIRRLDKGEGVVMPPEDSDLVGERLKDALDVDPNANTCRAPSDAQAMADAFGSFTAAARTLKAAELAFHAAQLAYADAVKRLSEEAVK